MILESFFASIDQKILLSILERSIKDKDILNLLNQVISSFNSGRVGVGLPLGNLTSQLLVNIYLNESDYFTKHKLKIKYYIRYADDFVILDTDKIELAKTLSYMIVFLRDRLRLELHPQKVSITTLASGVDFLGWVHFPHYSVLRTVTRRRVVQRLTNPEISESSKQSYLGLLRKGNTFNLQRKFQEK